MYNVFYFVGFFNRAYRNFKNLEIKCLQLDTLGYLLFDHALNLFSLSECETMYVESSSLYSSNRRDTWNLLCQSLENQSFSSVLDFYDFSDRLEKSMQHLSVEANHIKLNILNLSLQDLINYATTDKFSKTIEVLSFASENISDNRDLSIFDTIDAAGNLKAVLKQLNFFKVSSFEFCVEINYIFN